MSQPNVDVWLPWRPPALPGHSCIQWVAGRFRLFFLLVEPPRRARWPARCSMRFRCSSVAIPPFCWAVAGHSVSAAALSSRTPYTLYYIVYTLYLTLAVGYTRWGRACINRVP